MVGVHFPRAEAKEVVPLVSSAKIDVVGVDAVYSTSLAVRTDKDLLLGVVDWNDSEIESKERIVKRVEEAKSEAVFSGNLYLGPNEGLSNVPFKTALEKIRALADVDGV